MSVTEAPAATKVFHYTVEGSKYGEFPLDMLRRDCSQAATPADAALIERLCAFGEGKADLPRVVQVNLTLTSERYPPNVERWESFGWRVIASDHPRSYRLSSGSDKSDGEEPDDYLRRMRIKDHEKGGPGSRTTKQVADFFSLSTASARRLLTDLETQGRVYSFRYEGARDTYWAAPDPDAEVVTEADLRALFVHAVNVAGSQSAFVQQHGLSRTVVVATLSDPDAAIPSSIVKALGREKVVLTGYAKAGEDITAPLGFDQQEIVPDTIE